MDDAIRWAIARGRPGVVEQITDASGLLHAYQWLHDRYVDAGRIGRSVIGIRARPWEHDPCVRTWRRCGEHGIQGVLSLISPGDLGLPCDRVAPMRVAALRALGPVGEATNLCIDPGMRGASRVRAMVELFSAAYWTAMEEDLAHVAAAVDPEHARLLGRLCGFVELGPPCVYPHNPEFTGSGIDRGPADVVQLIAIDIPGQEALFRSVAERMMQTCDDNTKDGGGTSCPRGR